VVVEHTISRIKKFRIIGEEFRNRLRWYDRAADIVSGLVNLRTMGANMQRSCMHACVRTPSGLFLLHFRLFHA
jgi:hypothetical protein